MRPHCTNEYAKEKEKIYNNFSNISLGITSDYGPLSTERYISIKQITIKVDLYSVVILKSYFYHLIFCEHSIRISRSCE